MDSLIVEGDKSLKGNIFISGAKNSALPIMVSSLLLEHGKLKLFNIPMLRDILTMQKLLISLGCNVEFLQSESCIILDSSNLNNFLAPYDIVKQMRASFWVLAPILVRFKKARVPLPGGCSIGARPVDLHIELLKSMGASIVIDNGFVVATIKDKKLKACRFRFNLISVGATITAILASVMAEGVSYFYNCAIEPEIEDLCICLNRMGAKIKGIGTRDIVIFGQKHLVSASYSIMSDRIECGTYMIAAAITRGHVRIFNFNHIYLKTLIDSLRKIGSQVNINDDFIEIFHNGEIGSLSIETNPYPGFSTDLQSQFMSLMSISRGVCYIKENIFERRFLHVSELIKMGARISIEKNIAKISGVPTLTGMEVVSSDLRASAALLVAALAAKGVTKISRIYHLDRGYQNLETKLVNCGACIKRISE